MDIKVFKKACTLTFEFDSSDTTYGFLYNKTTGDFSDIEKINGKITYEVDKDGIYTFVLIDSNDITLSKEGIDKTVNGKTVKVKGFYVGTYAWYLEDYATAITNENWTGPTREKFYTKNTFCACKLEKCLLNLQMKVFRELVKTCGKGCKNLDEIKSQRDFLFIANWIMHHLEEYDRFEELLEIYEGIQSCNSLCDNLLKNNKCGCNG